jgi:hypothetical protein
VNDRRYIWLLPFLAAIACTAIVIHNHRRAARQSVELGYARRLHLELVGLEAENKRLESGQLTAADLQNLEDQHAKAEALRHRLDELRLKKPDGADQEPALVAAKDWVFSGRRTPQATIESVLWAASRGEVDRLAELLGFTPDVEAEADTMFSRLPAASKQEYGSAEKVVATLLAGSFPKDAQASTILTEHEYGDKDAAIAMAVTHSDGQGRTNVFQFRKTTDGWRLMIPAAILNDYEKTLLGDQQAAEAGPP